MDSNQSICLRSANHEWPLINGLGFLMNNEALTDCTIATEGKYIKAHRVVLTASSPYFASRLLEHCDLYPIIMLRDVKYWEMCALLQYMYRGEVNVRQDQLMSLLKAAQALQIKGLAESSKA